jgi:hypothetical protein
MLENRHSFGAIKWSCLILVFALGLVSCSVYTINKSDLENKLRPKSHAKRSLNVLTAMHSKSYNNAMDTLQCADAIGQIKTKRFNYDSKITIITNQKKTIRFYAKTLYIWKDQYLIGERTGISLYGPNYGLVKLSDINRIEVKKPWF